MHSGEEVQTTEAGTPRRPLVVGVGGSAAARESIERFLSRLAPDADVAIVLALRHREALDEAWLGEQLQRLGGVRLAHATDGAEIEGQTLYVCPANMITTLRGGRFAVRAAEQAPGERATIDSFLVALAEHSAERAIGVILAGTDGDGTLGIATLKDHSGLAIAELTEQTSSRLEDSNRAAAIADFVLAPEDIPEHISVYAQHLRRLDERQGFDEVLAAASTSLALRATRERLQAIIEELESTNKELRSSNEEYRSRNKELTTVNQELAHRVRELTRAASTVTRAEERQRLLLSELQHRVRNTLSVVRSIARRTAEKSSTVEDYAAHLDGRLNAFARTQSLVMRDPEEGVDLEYLVAEELHAYNASEGEQVRLSGPTIRLQPKAAETFALAIHELATNAIKYGALSRPSGQIEATWRIDESGPIQLVLDWRERGGPPVVPPQHKGFGTELLERTLAFELKAKATLTYDEAGLHCRIVVPLNRRIVHTPPLAGDD